MTDFASSITAARVRLVAVEDVVGRAGVPVSTRYAAVASSGSQLVVARDLGAGAVAELDVGAGVAEEPHGPQVQHDRSAPVPDVVDRGADVGEQPVGARRRRLDVLDPGQPPQRLPPASPPGCGC